MASVLIIFQIIIFIQFSKGYEYLELNGFTINSSLPSSSMDDWITQLNYDYQVLNKYSAFYAWNLNVHPTDEIYDNASKIGNIRIKWRQKRCNEVSDIFSKLTNTQKRMVYLLCRGPTYTEQQTNQLSNSLNEIQNIYTETKICLPRSFDICIDYNRIWNYTYIQDPSGIIVQLDMTAVTPKSFSFTPLIFFEPETSMNDVFMLNDEYIEDLFNTHEIIADRSIRTGPVLCLGIETELETIMTGNLSFLERSECVLPAELIFRWAWESWRLASGDRIKPIYQNVVNLMNMGARNSGYHDIGECWREELEIPNLRSVVQKLWKDFKPYYIKLHAVLRNALWKKYSVNKQNMIKNNGPLPAHLMGSMWAQDWSSYYKLLNPFSDVDLDDNFQNSDWTSIDMVKKADDFYSSLGLPYMTEKFWKKSKFHKGLDVRKCHGTAANMFQKDDYRMIVCAEKNLNDFYVIVHEMGHIQYYMLASNQPPLFQDATNSAFSEAIGDAIFTAMMTPQHLNRLRLLPDKDLFTKIHPTINYSNIRKIHEVEPNFKFMDTSFEEELNAKKKLSQSTFNNSKIKDYLPEETIDNNDGKDSPIWNYDNFEGNKNNLNTQASDLSLLLRMALAKLPQIPFEFILDIFRWDLFSGEISFNDANVFYWQLRLNEQGIQPPGSQTRNEFFDAGSKFHVADNTPYVRYFLASFLQAQIFKGLCEKTVFNRVNPNQKLPMPLHRCDIYGSKRAGKLLRKALGKGASTNSTEILFILTGKTEISIEPLIEYYQPLFNWIDELLIDFKMPVGW